MIEIKDLTFHYSNSSDIISSLSLDISENSCVAIIGESGCGKTTLLNLIAGIITPNKGFVRKKTDDISYLMQYVTLLPYKTALENALLAYELRNKCVDKNIEKKAKELLALFRMGEDSFLKFPGELSGGMKQRIGLVQTLLTSSDLVLLDEPFNAIDVNALETIENYIWRYTKEERRTMVFITHNIEQALLLSDWVVIMGNNQAIQYVIPDKEYVELPPSQRIKKQEYKSLFYEIMERMKL